MKFIKIKVKNTSPKIIRTLNKEVILSDKLKDKVVNIKEKEDNLVYDNYQNSNDYAISKINDSIRSIPHGVNLINNRGLNSFKESRENIISYKRKFKNLGNKIKQPSKGNKISKDIFNKVKKNKNSIEKSKVIANKTYKTSKSAIKAGISSVKNIIGAINNSINLLIAGGWIVLVIIIVICMIALLCSSIYGIFFSNESIDNGISMSLVINSINEEINNEIEKIKISNVYDNYEINYDLADWKEVLTIYTVKEFENNINSQLMVLDTNKINKLKLIFWDFNEVSYEMTDTGEQRNLIINIHHKSLMDMVDIYNFSEEQRKQTLELSSKKYDYLWKPLIYSTKPVKKGEYVFPVGGFYTITQGYSETHKAIDIASSYGSNIYAVADGVVYLVKDGCIIGDLQCNGKAGNYITIKHNDNVHYSSYMHLKSCNVKVGDSVKAGQVIGYMGNTGNVEPIPTDINSKNGTHLHFVILCDSIHKCTLY